MWVALALLAAFGNAATTAGLKLTIARGGLIASMVSFRFVTGVLLLALTAAVGAWPTLTPTYWRIAALILIPEVAGLAFVTLALRTGDVSLVQPITGLLPLFVMLGGAVFLGEQPAPGAAGGVVLVTAGIYCIGLQGRRSLLAPLYALAREPAGRYAFLGAIAWSITTLMHKAGIAEVGAFPWAVTLSFGSSLVLAVALPFAKRSAPATAARGPWLLFMLATGTAYALQMGGLNLALQRAQAGYVIALASLSTLIATVFGIVVMGERTAARNRAIGSLLVSAGAVLVALYG